MTSNPKSYLSISLQMLFSIFSIFLQFHPINTDIFHPRWQWPSWANWSCTDSSDLPWKAEHSSLQEALHITLFPPLNDVSSPISSPPQAVISSYLEATIAAKYNVSSQLLFYVPFLCRAALTRDRRWVKGTLSRNGQSWDIWPPDKKLCLPRQNVIKAWKNSEFRVANYFLLRAKSNGYCTILCQTGF